MHVASVPIGVFAYNRPAHLKACLEAIDRSKACLGHQLPIHIFCDAPGKPEDEEAVAATVAVAQAYPQAIVVVREKNRGFRNIPEGISELFEAHEQAIIIEDDVLISPDFLPFICEGLKRYQDDPRVFMISGFMYFGTVAKRPFFLNPAFIWGWATWKRAWRYYDFNAPDWESFVYDKRRCFQYDCLGSIPFSKHLRKTMTGEWKAWAPQWAFTMEKQEGLALYPPRSLVWNCGCGGGAHGDSILNLDPLLGNREKYIHGDLEFSDFTRQRLKKDETRLPLQVKVNKRILRQLAIIFLQERLIQKSRKRWRLYLKLWLHKIAACAESTLLM